jgi:polyhydroxybutyrate depolymerase
VRLLVQTIVLSALATLLTIFGVAAETMQLVVNGQPRAALIERPTAEGPRPTIIMLHGAGRRAWDIAQETRLAQLAPREGWVAVFPEGRGGRWNFFPHGKETARDVQFFQQHGGLPDDAAFLKMLVGDLVRRGVSDSKRIYIAGLSLGGVMALRMACADAGMFAAIGLLISAMSEVAGTECQPAKPLPLLTVSGTADAALPYTGGQSIRGDSLWSVERLIGFFRRLNGCSAAAEHSVLSGPNPQRIEIERSTKCSGAPVILYRIVGGVHEVPPGLNAGQLLLDFFRDKTR